MDTEVWIIRINPSGNDDVTLKLAPRTNQNCAESRAVCTDADKPLSAVVTRTIPGPSTTQAVALTAEFVADSLPSRTRVRTPLSRCGCGSTKTRPSTACAMR